MSNGDDMRRLFRLPRSEETLGRDVEEEIAFHMESRISQLMAAGLPEAEARRRAAQKFGDVGAARTELLQIDRVTLHRTRRSERWDTVRYELRLAMRSLLRAPALASAVVLTLGLGIGVNAAMFGLADRLLLSPPPHVQEPERLVRVLYQSTPPWEGALRTESLMAFADYTVQRDEVSAYEAVAAYSVPITSALGSGAGATDLRMLGVTPGYFELLGVRPALGRFISETEGAVPRGERVAVLSHDLWRSRFGGDLQIIGTAVELDNAQFTVIGVAPRGFTGIDHAPVDAWIPISTTAHAAGDWYRTRAMSWVRIIARLAPGVTVEAAAAEATRAYLAPEDLQIRYQGDTTARVVLGSIVAARSHAVGLGTAQRSGRIALWLLGVSTVVLIIACANTANLLLARGLRRRRELGVRLALGSGGRRLALQVLLETLLLGVAAGTVALLLAHWGGLLARGLLLPEFDWGVGPVDRRVLVFAALATLFSALLAALLPAWHAARSDVTTLMGGTGRGGTYRRSPLRTGLVMLQAMLSVLLLVGAGLFVRSLHNASTVQLGFGPERVVLLDWHRAGLGWPAARVLDVYERSLQRLQMLPQVEAAALSMNVPMHSAGGATLRVPERDSVPQPPGMFGFLYNAVSPDYFRTMDTRVLRGRAFTDNDVAGSAPVAIITASLASWLWPGENALGRCVVHMSGENPPCREVVGIVDDVHYRHVEGDPDMVLFLPLAQGPPWPLRVLSVRTRGPIEEHLPHIRAALHTLESGMPHLRATPLRARIAPQLQPWRLGAALFLAFGLLALLLAALGLYGVVAYDVAQRTRELGVRTALGARARDIVGLVLGDATRVVLGGLLAGVVLAAWAAPRLEGLLFAVPPHDRAVFVGVVVLLLASGLMAALLPGLRATRIQPVEALRQE